MSFDPLPLRTILEKDDLFIYDLCALEKSIVNIGMQINALNGKHSLGLVGSIIIKTNGCDDVYVSTDDNRAFISWTVEALTIKRRAMIQELISLCQKEINQFPEAE